jgi:hypothetical protein
MLADSRDSINPNDLYDYLHINKDLVTGFMIMFSRFEYALKKTEYCKKDHNDNAEPDWPTFARDHNNLFEARKNPKLKAAIQYLLEHPPKRQVVNNDGKLDWKKRNLNSEALLENLVCSVKGVRNNLFHGGKFESGSVGDPARNTLLLENCITVLSEFLSLNPTIKNTFFSEW